MSENTTSETNAEQRSKEAGLDRRGFLTISSAVAATAAVAGSGLAVEAASQKSRPAKNQPAGRPAGAARDFKGGWFVV